MKKNNHIRQQFQRFLDDRHSKGDLEALLNYVEDDRNHPDGAVAALVRAALTGNMAATDRNGEIDRQTEAARNAEIDRIGTRVRANLAQELAPDRRPQPTPQTHRLHKIYRRLGAVAAAVLILSAVSLSLFLLKRDNESEQTAETTTWSLDESISRGNPATLLMDDGTAYVLDENQKGIVVDQEITYLDGTRLLPADQMLGDQSTAMRLTLQIPEGSTYRLKLPDGTLVWLNASSSLSYPLRFPPGERRVELQGEAYFDVTTDGRFFKVVTNGQTIEVLGTRFNVYAYPDESASHVTLVEGRVAVAGSILKPGQQALIRSGNLSVREVGTAAYTAWLEGRVTFDGKPFAQIMQELARWYGFDVRYEGPVPDDRFIGGVHRTDQIGTALQFLESSGIPYRLEKSPQGRRQLIIMNER